MSEQDAIERLPPLRDVVQRHDLAAKRSLGQNFLFDLNLTRKIARTAGPLAETICVEIGPGPGGLTRALLLEGALRVIAIERDERCLAALGEIAAAASGRLSVIAGDALEIDARTLLGDVPEGAAVRIVANLPYNIAVVLLTRWLETEPWPPWFDRLTLMFQREVAERIVATPSDRANYGRLSILSGWRTQARILFDIPPSAFTPPPKVVSSVVEFIPRANPLPCEARILTDVTHAAFGQRRKMLRQSLKTLRTSGYDVAAETLLEETGIEPTKRAEQLEIEDFVRLARAAAPYHTR